MQDICDIFDPQASAKGVRVTCKVLKRLGLPDSETIGKSTSGSTGSTEIIDERASIPLLLGDVRRFKQVLINLVKNALKFTSSGTVEIMASYLVSQSSNDENLLVVHVKDTGRGILLEDIPKLFTKFGKL